MWSIAAFLLGVPTNVQASDLMSIVSQPLASAARVRSSSVLLRRLTGEDGTFLPSPNVRCYGSFAEQPTSAALTFVDALVETVTLSSIFGKISVRGSESRAVVPVLDHFRKIVCR